MKCKHCGITVLMYGGWWIDSIAWERDGVNNPDCPESPDALHYPEVE